MPLRYEYDRQENILHTYCSEKISSADILTHFQEIATDPAIRNNYIEVVHFSETSEICFSADQASLFPEHYARLKAGKSILATIFIGETPLQYGIGRMMENLHEVYDPNDIVRVVRSEEEAARAIREIRNSAPGSTPNGSRAGTA